MIMYCELFPSLAKNLAVSQELHYAKENHIHNSSPIGQIRLRQKMVDVDNRDYLMIRRILFLLLIGTGVFLEYADKFQ